MTVRIEEYLGSLPRDAVTGDGVQLPDRAFREIFEFVGLGAGDVLYHLGCGDGRGLEIARKEFGPKRIVGVDSDPKKVGVARGRGLGGTDVVCDDVRNADIGDATVVLFWFDDQDVVWDMVERFGGVPDGCRVVTVWDALADSIPDRVSFPYLLHKTPLTRARSVREQVLAVFGVRCIDFVTAWEHAERYTRAVGGEEAGNDRFLTMMQSVVIWINARNAGVACDKEMPESVRTYVSVLREFFGIETEHLLKKEGGDG